jgi:hypothetical protein
MKNKNLTSKSLNKQKNLFPNLKKNFLQSQNSFILKGIPLYKKWNNINYKQRFGFNIFGRPKIEEKNWNDNNIIENNNDLLITNTLKKPKEQLKNNKKQTKLNFKIENNLNYSLKGSNNFSRNKNNEFQIVNKQSEYLIESISNYTMYEKISQSNELNLTIKNFQKSVPNLLNLYKVHANQLTIEREEPNLIIQKNPMLNIISTKTILFQPLKINQFNIFLTNKKEKIFNFQNINKFTIYGDKIKENIKFIYKTIHNNLLPIKANQLVIESTKKILYTQKISKFTLYGKKKEKTIILPFRIGQIYYEPIKKIKINYKIIRNCQINIFNKQKKFLLYPIKVNKFELIGKPKIIKPKRKKIYKIQSNIQITIKRKHYFYNLSIRKYNNLIIKSKPKKLKKPILKQIKTTTLNIKGIKKEPQKIFIKQEPQKIYIKQEPEKIYIKQEPEKIYIKQELPSWNLKNKIVKVNKLNIYPQFINKKKDTTISFSHQNFQILPFIKYYIISKNNDINYISEKKPTWNQLNICEHNIIENYIPLKKSIIKINKNEISFGKNEDDSFANDIIEKKEIKLKSKPKIDDKIRNQIADELFKEEVPKKMTVFKNPQYSNNNYINNQPLKNKFIKDEDIITRHINTKAVNDIRDIQGLLRRRDNNLNDKELLREFKQDRNPFS